MTTKTNEKPQLKEVVPELLKPNPWQPRQTMDLEELQKLADSIKQVGLLQRPLVREVVEEPDLERPCTCPKDGVGAPKPGCPQHFPGYQIAFGHLRIEAMKSLNWEAIPVEVRILTDEQMAMVALTENLRRKDITPLEEAKAYRHALDTIQGLTVEKLAETIGLARPTLSNILRVLRLPDVILDRVAAGEMSVRAARELLCLQNDKIVRIEEMKRVVRDISMTEGRSGMPDWRVKHVREVIRDVIQNSNQNWRPIDSDHQNADFMGFRGPADRREVDFDPELFAREFPDHVFTIPTYSKGTYEGTRRWTDEVRAWQRWQTAATIALNKAMEEKGQPKQKVTGTGRPTKDTAYLMAMAKDPLVKAVTGKGVSWETAAAEVAQNLEAIVVKNKITGPEGKSDVVKAVQAEVIKRLKTLPPEKELWAGLRNQGRRITDELGIPRDQISWEISNAVQGVVALAEAEVEKVIASQAQGKLTEEQQKALGTRAEAPLVFGWDNKAFHERLRDAPPYLHDKEECLSKCTWGARYGQESRGATVELYCANKECWNNKIQVGMEAFRKKLDHDVAQQDKEDLRLARLLKEQLSPGLAQALGMAIMVKTQHYGPTVPKGIGGDDASKFAYEPQTIQRIRQLLVLKARKEGSRDRPWERPGISSFSVDEAVKQLTEWASHEILREVGALVLVHTLRHEVKNGVAWATDTLKDPKSTTVS